MAHQPTQAKVRGSSLIAILIAVIALLVSLWAASQVVASDTPSESFTAFSAPVNLSGLMQEISPGVVTIYCRDGQGTGWVLDHRVRGRMFTSSRDVNLALFPGNIVTNYHVIEACIEEPQGVRVIAGGKRQNAILYTWDQTNDLALIVIAERLMTLPLSAQPEPGWWSMVYGTPYGRPGSITVGNVITVHKSQVSSSTPLNPGNSGGPLINSAGEVIGTVTGSDSDELSQNWNYAAGLPMLCRKILKCAPNEFGWAATS